MATSVAKTKFEFFGPYVGPFGIILGLPTVCYALAFLVVGTDVSDWRALWQSTEIMSPFGWIAVFGYLALVLAMHLLLPAKTKKGVVLQDNVTSLRYRLNGLSVFVLIYSTVFCLTFLNDSLDLSAVHRQWVPCLTASLSISIGLSIYLFMSSFHPKAKLAKGGQTGYHLYDFFMGRELNPRLGSLDLKEFCELYPGLIGWTLLNLSNCHQQWQQSFGHITNSMVLINVFQFIYVFDALYYEPSILTTMDITSDGFGFMLAFGDLTWLPFIYTLQSKFLVHNPTELSLSYATFVVCLNIVGYWIFRGANSQKDQFRRDPLNPSVAHLKFMRTSRGRNLIVSSWWGLARHINYTGDWLMGLSWCLTCGFASPVPYFYAVYFGILLVHRDRRDQESCRAKYGADWDAYCALVPYRFVPYIY